jgi:hypothetical protein
MKVIEEGTCKEDGHEYDARLCAASSIRTDYVTMMVAWWMS